MKHASPAIVAQSAVRRLPRWALLLFCLAYVLPGFIGREPWKGADMAEFGYMAELARGGVSWLHPQLMGLVPEVDGLLAYWLGAWAIQLAPSALASELASRIPFALLLGLAMWATWWGTYFLALSPKAQPVAFAFGGEALPTDYARAIADGGLLALIACLGLAQLSHETTPAQIQLSFSALTFYAFAALPYRTALPMLLGTVGLAGLTLSGAPSLAVVLGLGGVLLGLLDRSEPHQPDSDSPINYRRKLMALVGVTLALAGLASWLELWQWRIVLPQAQWLVWRNLGRSLLWFTWPAWPLALWSLWRWRQQISSGEISRHLALPLWFVLVALLTTLLTSASHRSLLLALPALATLAAFALPTLQRSVAALIDWFTLLFFSGCGLIIWIVWLAMQTGFPAQPAANVMRLAPGFTASFSLLPFLLALFATSAWIWLVMWRVGRHRAAIWKSLVLPAAGAALCWLLLMSLWLPLLDYARSYAPLVSQANKLVGKNDCVEVQGLSRAQIAALRHQAQFKLTPTNATMHCPWLLLSSEQRADKAVDLQQWRWHSSLRRLGERSDNMQLYQRKNPMALRESAPTPPTTH
ncbi:MAG: hypothetical protein WBI20_13645 [Burkholderiaceae bacterium]